jgi:beta-lactamase regulating signal transducer with metallopeptidase domain
MDAAFLKLLNMNIAASWLILAVLVLRFLLKKAPKWLPCILWAVVAIRLICPFSFESGLSLIPSAETISLDILYAQVPVIHSGIPALNNVVNPVITNSFAPTLAASINPLQVWTYIASYVWLLGISAMLIYATVSFLRLRKKVGASINIRDNLWICDDIKTPFILGIISPRIYLPSAMDEAQQAYVIAHETAHLQRRDHWWKPLGFLLLTVYWLNPLLWLAYILLCRDIEIACDERVVREMDLEDKKAYSDALLSCSLPRHMVVACPLAFGEVGVKERIKTVLNYKKPAFWIIVVAVITCIVTAVCFLTNPINDSARNPYVQEYTPGQGNIRGSVDTASFEQISEDFAIGADQYGIAVFKDPNKAFETFRTLYANGIALIQKENDLPPFSQKTYDLYKTYGWQTTTGTEKQQAQATFVTKFLDVYENSFTKEPPNLDYVEPTAEAPVLSLNDIIILSQKGEELSWEDFDKFTYIETGSGLYIRVYEINPGFSLWIGGGGPGREPMYISLRTNTGPEDSIDIRTESVADFISRHRDDYLNAVIADAVLKEYGNDRILTGEFPCESHVILATEGGDPTGSNQTGAVTVYALILYQRYTYFNGELTESGGSYIPTALTFDISASGEYTLTEYWIPRDGSYYADDIRKKFPGASAQDALNHQDYIEELQKNCKAQAEAYFSSVDIEGSIAQLLKSICSSPATSSNPGDYIKEHQSDYDTLLSYGDYALCYIFAEFLKGGQTDLRGHIMRIAMNDLIGGEAMGFETETGQEYFDEWYAYARRLLKANGDEYMEKYQPKAWLLLQMTAE